MERTFHHSHISVPLVQGGPSGFFLGKLIRPQEANLLAYHLGRIYMLTVYWKQEAQTRVINIESSKVTSPDLVDTVIHYIYSGGCKYSVHLQHQPIQALTAKSKLWIWRRSREPRSRVQIRLQ